MLPDVLSWLRAEIYEGSPFCERAKNGGEEYQRYLKKRRLRGLALDLSNRDNSDIQRQIECQNDFMCVDIRGRLYREKIPISQIDYDEVAVHCEGRYSCIAEFFVGWPRDILTSTEPNNPSGFETTPKSSQPSRITLADLRKPSTRAVAEPHKDGQAALSNPVSATGPISLSDIRKPSESVEQEGSSSRRISLGSVVEHRTRIELEQVSKDLASRLSRVQSICGCSLSQQSCYSNSYGPIKDQIADLNRQRLDQCSAINDLAVDANEGDLAALKNQLLRLSDRQTMIRQIDSRADALIAKAKSDYEKLVAATQAQKNQSGFQWGKFTALGVGALAGGITELEAEDQIEFLGAMVSDSTAGVMGLDNMQRKAASGSTTISTGKPGPQAGSGLKLACDLPSQSICVEYTLENQATFNRFRSQCQQSGARISRSCPVSGPACTHTTGNRTSVTIAVDKDPGVIRSRCEASGGTFTMR